MDQEKRRAMVLLSGGLNSAITAAYLLKNGHEIGGAVFIARGQSNFECELKAATMVALHLGIPLYHAVLAFPNLTYLIPKEKLYRVGTPARNFILGAIALPYAAILNCDALVFGNIVSDELPDCSRNFRLKFTDAASQALNRGMEVVAPLADWENWDKADEIRFAAENGYGKLFKLTWTCRQQGTVHCGVCDACKARKEGFKKAGIKDPVTYAQ